VRTLGQDLPSLRTGRTYPGDGPTRVPSCKGAELRRYRELTGWLNGLVGVKKSIVWSLVGAGAGVLIAALEFTLDHRGLNWWVILFMTCIGALRAFSFERDKKPDKSEPPQPPVNRYTRM
jgi:hypothetical protein